MTIDPQKFYQATNPSKTLRVICPQDQKYYFEYRQDGESWFGVNPIRLAAAIQGDMG